MAIGHNLKLRLFLEGIEIPVIGASVQIGSNAPAVASIQVIATDKILNIHPRTVVHLFFYDFVDGVVDYGAIIGSKKKIPGNELLADVANDQYKLLFMGEVQGLSFSKDTGSRSVVLNCVDFSNYWDTTFQYNFKGSLLGGRKHAAFIGANANFFTGPLGHGTGTIAALLSNRSVNFPQLKGLLGGIVRILEAIGGSYYGETTFRGANDFTSIAELRLKILQQITAAEKDSSTSKLFARKTFNAWMNRQMGSLGKLVTFRGLTRVIQQFVYHEIFSNPVAKYVPKVTGLKKTKVYSVALDKDPRTRDLFTKVKRLEKLVNSAKANINKLIETKQPGYLSSYLGGKPTTTINPNIGRALEHDITQANAIIGSLISGVTGSTLPGVARHIATVSSSLSTVGRQIGAGSIFARAFRLDANKAGKAENLRKADAALFSAQAAIQTLLNKKNKKSRSITYDKLDRVNNQILRPDIWFAAAPRCNVLFPELYGNFQWSRNFLREVSRMELQTTNEILGSDALFNGRYYAPNVADMRSGLRLSSRRFGRLIMAHELMTGIIPMFEKLSEANLFAMKSRKVKYKGAKVGYAQRSVNFQYFKHRFASRQMSASGRFNPWFVCGFPGILIDRPMDAVNLAIAGLGIAEQLKALDIIPAKNADITRATLLRQLVPVQYMGSCASLVHSLNQGGGQTQYGFTQARVHREDTEFLGVDKATVSKVIGTSTRTRPYAALPSSAPKVKGRGQFGGRITKVVDVTSQYLNSYLPIYGASKKTSKVKIGSRDDISAVFGTGAQQSSNENFKAYKVTELSTRRARTKVDLPIEFAIHPPWIWDGWGNLKIGETYEQFFGTTAITDIAGASNTGLLSTLVGADSLQATLDTKEGYTYGSGTAKDETADQFLTRLSSDDSTDNRKNKKAVEVAGSDSKVSATAVLAMEQERTIENSVDFIVRTYSFIRAHSLDVSSFIRNYGWRPVATMTEILGSADFSITEKTKLVLAGKTFEELRLTELPDGLVIKGSEGFHSRAFGDTSDLFGLVDPKVKKVLGLSVEKRHATAKKLDVRGRRREAVVDYVSELEQSKGLLG